MQIHKPQQIKTPSLCALQTFTTGQTEHLSWQANNQDGGGGPRTISTFSVRSFFYHVKKTDRNAIIHFSFMNSFLHTISFVHLVLHMFNLAFHILDTQQSLTCLYSIYGSVFV